MALVVGNDLKLYYNTGTDTSPVWVEINIVGDVTVNINIGEAEVDLRVSDWVLALPAKLSGGFEFTLANHIGDTNWDALRALALARTQKQFASANGAIATVGTEYFKAYAFFTAFPWSQPTQEMSSGDCTLALGYTEESSTLVEPAWAETTS